MAIEGDHGSQPFVCPPNLHTFSASSARWEADQREFFRPAIATSINRARQAQTNETTKRRPVLMSGLAFGPFRPYLPHQQWRDQKKTDRRDFLSRQPARGPFWRMLSQAMPGKGISSCARPTPGPAIFVNAWFRDHNRRRSLGAGGRYPGIPPSPKASMRTRIIRLQGRHDLRGQVSLTRPGMAHTIIAFPFPAA